MAATAPNLYELEVSVFGPCFGESSVVHYGDGNWIIVDSCISPATGNPVAIDYLTDIGVDYATAVKLIVITHWHSDHIEGASSIVKDCPNAEICVPASFTKDEFISYLASFNDPTQKRHGNGIDEILEVFKLARKRQKKLATADRRLLANTINMEGEETKCEIWSLSPSDLAIAEALAQLGALLPGERETIRRATPTDQNDHSIVLWITVGETALLLGADLEETANSASGWTAIVNSTARPQGRADVFKVPHHGSQNAHSDDVWETMLVDKAVAVVTPWNRGQKLPKERDLVRLNKLTDKLYLTAPPEDKHRLKHDRFVEKVMRDFGVKTYVDAEGIGHVRCRKQINVVGDWVVEQFSLSSDP